ncbi:MAG: YjbQ family protein [Candidatus Bathyarchaeota archaeon]|nr:MAG: YjbQ family protein [Candidatus Bathyarchaeota archaeon]
MKIFNQNIEFSTKGEIEFVNITKKLEEIVTKSQVRDGIAHIFAPHATGVLVLTEADRNLLEDIEKILEKLIPKQASYRHPSNAHSHLRSMFLSPEKTLPIRNYKLVFGTWQSLLFIETDVHARHRSLIVSIIGE